MGEQSTERTLLADRFHTGARLASMLVWFAAIVAIYRLGLAIINLMIGPVAGLGVILLLIAAVLLAQPVAWLGEREITTRWRSGRAARLLPRTLEWQDKGTTEHIDLDDPVNFWRWRFVVGNRRGGRVPNGHRCLAIRLVQGETVVSLYAFVAPATADELEARYTFYQLSRSVVPADKRMLGGRDAIFLAAEHQRADEGAELEPPDFEALLDHLNAHLPEFASAPTSGVMS
jgi:hypothetical protein